MHLLSVVVFTAVVDLTRRRWPAMLDRPPWSTRPWSSWRRGRPAAVVVELARIADGQVDGPVVIRPAVVVELARGGPGASPRSTAPGHVARRWADSVRQWSNML
jgi:hypothetical protein